MWFQQAFIHPLSSVNDSAERQLKTNFASEEHPLYSNDIYQFCLAPEEPPICSGKHKSLNRIVWIKHTIHRVKNSKPPQ